MNPSRGIHAGSCHWPHTRIRRRGLAGYKNIRMRRFLQKSAATLGILFVFALGYVWTRVQVIETGYRLSRLEEAREKLKEENHALRVEAATFRSPQRLERLATEFGLKRPAENQVYILGEALVSHTE